MIRCMPVLQVSNVKTSEKFYCDKLGFKSLARGVKVRTSPLFNVAT